MRFFPGIVTLGLLSSASLAFTGCNTGGAQPEPKPAQPQATAAPVTAKSEGALRLGAAIDKSAPKVALADVAKNPNGYVGKSFTTTGTITAVCQHMGCWMEIKDDAGEAHVKMAGHSFFIPKSASGKKAEVLAKLVKSEDKGACEGEGHDKGDKSGKGGGCRAEAEQQLGRPLAKLELVADGVELQP